MDIVERIINMTTTTTSHNSFHDNYHRTTIREESGVEGSRRNQEVNKEHSKNIQKFPKVSSYDWFLSFMSPNEIINKGIRSLSTDLQIHRIDKFSIFGISGNFKRR